MELTTPQAAKQIGVHPITARRLCAEHGIGRMVTPALRLLSEADVRRLENIVQPVGRPKIARRKSLPDKD